MTSSSQTSAQAQLAAQPAQPEPRRPIFSRLLGGMRIGSKLVTGFGLLVFVTLIIIGISYLASRNATETIDTTGEVRVPIAIAAQRARADLLRMLGSTRQYLFVGDRNLRQQYLEDSQSFEDDLLALQARAGDLSEANKQNLAELQALFAQWKPIAERMFDLRDDQLEREPAYKLLATDGIKTGGAVLVDIQELIDLQAARTPSAESVGQLRDMASFQGTFSSMLSGLRGYVTTRNRIFRGEYESNRSLNDLAWKRLEERAASFDPSQRAVFERIKQNREAFLALPDQMFAVLESDQWRQDLYLFRTDAQELGDRMSELLNAITEEQQVLLESDLDRGRTGLADANLRSQIGGLLALLLGLALTYIFQDNIAGPVRRLTTVAEQIREGNLSARARIEARDEVGTLARAFNSMTSQLRQTIDDVRREKKRADDLLNVVIPIGVSLTAERDFNRLLETMLVEAKEFCRARAGTLYLREGDQLRFAIVRNDAQGMSYGGSSGKEVPFAPLELRNADGTPNHEYVATHVALQGEAINLPSTHEGAGLAYSGPHEFSSEHGYEATSLLTIPLRNSAGEVLGVMQLIDAEDPVTGEIVPFDSNLQQMMSSFSSLAVAALEAYVREQSLRQQIQQLHIEIDEAKRQKQVSEIVDTDFFQSLQAKARAARQRGRPQREGEDSS